MIEFIIFIVAFVFVLFLLFSLSKSDFVLLRKNVSQHELFDKTIIGMIAGLFAARIFYIIDVQNYSLFNPFRFFHLVKLPGLSFYGFFIGLIPVIYLLLRKKQVVSRVYDIILISLLPLFTYVLVIRSYTLFVPDFIVKIVLLLIGAWLINIFIRFFYNYTLKDGSVALIIFMLISVDLFLYAFTEKNKPLLLTFTVSQILACLLFWVAFALLLVNQNIIFKKKHK